MQKYEIGFTWDVYGWNQQKVYQKTILDAKEKDGVLYYLVANNEFHEDFSGFKSVYSSDELEQVLEFDKENLEFDLKAHKEREIQKQKDEERKKIEEDTDGFADQFTPMKRGKIIKTLNVLLRLNGLVLTRKEHIRKAVSEGWTVKLETIGYMRREKAVTKEVMVKGDYLRDFLTKTEIDYAKFLINKIALNE